MKNKEQTVSGWNLFRSSRKLISCIVAILLVMQLVSCSKTNKKDTSTVEDDGYRIYYINKNSTGLVYDSYKTDTKDTALLLEELLQRMGTDSKKYGAKKVLGETILVKETTISDNQLSLNFDSNYTNQPKINEVLTRADIVMTVTQIPGIDDVEFTVSGQPLMDSYEKPIGLMSASDFIDTTDVGL